jgi:Predicted hydrolases or acyltransferases (alpha/beta hydrolase superfamily)
MDTVSAEREWTARVNGTGLRVGEVGAGAETVVFSPALFTNRGMFDPLVNALKTDHRCIRYDHRGQGDSGFGTRQPASLLSTEGLYADAVALLDELHVESCHWAGASIGGFVGMRLAARRPERIRSLVLIGPAMHPLSAADRRQINMLALAIRVVGLLGPFGGAMRRSLADRVMRNMFGATFMADPARAEIREFWRQRYAAQLVPKAVPMARAVFGYPENTQEMLGHITAPTLLVVGDNPPAGVEPADANVEDREIQQAIPGSRLVIIPGAGHMVLVEEPAAATAVITEFIRSAPAKT